MCFRAPELGPGVPGVDSGDETVALPQLALAAVAKIVRGADRRLVVVGLDDAIKKEALRRAGIGYFEVVAGDTPAELRRVVERLVQGDSNARA